MTEEEMKILNTNDFLKGVGVIEDYWNQDYGTFNLQTGYGIATLELTTGMFWFLWWQESKRGGYYKFIYKGKMED